MVGVNRILAVQVVTGAVQAVAGLAGYVVCHAGV